MKFINLRIKLKGKVVLSGGIILSSLIVAIIILSFSSNLQPVEAQAGGMTSPFGGTITDVDICCNGLKLNIQSVSSGGGLASGEMMLTWVTFLTGLYANYLPLPQSCVLGLATQQAQCIDISDECESEDSVDYKIKMIGTNSGQSC